MIDRNKICLVGYMGSGKTTVGKELATLMKLPFIDLDEEISTSENSSLSDIFDKKGELYFRKKEREMLSNLLSQPTGFILSTGGGTPAYFENMKLINTCGISVFLMASPSEILKRIQEEIHTRPLLTSVSEENRLNFIGNHLFERLPYYHQASIKIKTDGKNPKDLAQILKDQLSEFQP